MKTKPFVAEAKMGKGGERRTVPRIDQSVGKHGVIRFFSVIYRYKELEIYHET